jgi:hypothetical protein
MSSNAPVATKPGPTMTPEDLAALRTAVRLLEHPGLAARLTNLVGKPIDLISNALPAAASRAIATATAKGLEAALKVALRTMQRSPHAGSQLLHKALATASGAAGGAFGVATLPIELPVSTIIMLRSIADIARSEEKIFPNRNRHYHAFRSLHWADVPARPIRPKAVILPRELCSRRVLLTPHASSRSAVLSRKGPRFWSVSLRKWRPALASW